MHFTYRLTGTGWAEATLSDAGTPLVVPASYLVDALGELLLAITVLQEGDTSAACSWDLEPGEFRWLFRRDGELVRISVLQFPDWLPRRPDEKGFEVFATQAPLRDVARAFATGARAVLDEWGEDGYRAKWVEHPFPTELLELVERGAAT